MVDIIKALKDKPEPLAKKADELGTSTPTIPALSLGTQKQGEMMVTPQAQQARVKRESQKAQRTAQVQSAAPREDEEAQDSVVRAQSLISNLANLNQQQVQEASAAALEAEQAQVGAARTGEQLLGEAGEQIMGLTDAELEQQAKANITDTLLGNEQDPGILDQTLTLTLGELKQNPEFADVVSYAQSIGLTDENATLEQIKDAVDTEINEVTAIVDHQRDLINDPNVPSAERQQARRTLKDYGASHLLASEQEMDEFAGDMSSVGMITIGGKEYTLEDLADNEAIAASLSSAAGTLLSNPDATPEDTGLSDFPEMFQFVQKHAAALESVLDQEKDNLGRVQGIVGKNLEAFNAMDEHTKKVLDLNPFVNKNMIEDMPSLEIFKPGFDATSLGFDSNTLKGGIEHLSEVRPDLIQSIMSDPEYKDKLSQMIPRAQSHKAMMDSDSLDAIVLMGSNLNNTSELRSILTDMKKYPNSYSEEQKQAMAVFDSNNDGWPDDLGQIKGRLSERMLDPNKSSLVFPEAFGKQVTSNFSKKAKELGFDPKNIYKLGEKITHKDDMTTKLRKVNSLLKEVRRGMTGDLEKHPFLNQLKKQLVYAHGQLRKNLHKVGEKAEVRFKDSIEAQRPAEGSEFVTNQSSPTLETSPEFAKPTYKKVRGKAGQNFIVDEHTGKIVGENLDKDYYG
jgi:hypothetical protein